MTNKMRRMILTALFLVACIKLIGCVSLPPGQPGISEEQDKELLKSRDNGEPSESQSDVAQSNSKTSLKSGEELLSTKLLPNSSVDIRSNTTIQQAKGKALTDKSVLDEKQTTRERIMANIEGFEMPKVVTRESLADMDRNGTIWTLFWFMLFDGTLTDEEIELICSILCEVIGQCPPSCPGYYQPPWGGAYNLSTILRDPK